MMLLVCLYNNRIYKYAAKTDGSLWDPYKTAIYKLKLSESGHKPFTVRSVYQQHALGTY